MGPGVEFVAVADEATSDRLEPVNGRITLGQDIGNHLGFTDTR